MKDEGKQNRESITETDRIIKFCLTENGSDAVDGYPTDPNVEIFEFSEEEGFLRIIREKAPEKRGRFKELVPWVLGRLRTLFIN